MSTQTFPDIFAIAERVIREEWWPRTPEAEPHE